MTTLDFPAVYLVHGTGGCPDGSARLLQIELEKCGVQQNDARPLMPHSDPALLPSESVQYLRDHGIPEGTLIIGISLGGLVAAKLQESARPDLHVFCVNSPTWAGDTELHVKMKHRVALYCSADPVIAGRTERWPRLALSCDLPWLTHDTDKHKSALAHIISCYIHTGCLSMEKSDDGKIA